MNTLKDSLHLKKIILRWLNIKNYLPFKINSIKSICIYSREKIKKSFANKKI